MDLRRFSRYGKVSVFIGGLVLSGHTLQRDLAQRSPQAAPGPSGYAEVPEPVGCRQVMAGESLQLAVDAAPAGTSLCLAAGSYSGPVRLEKPLTVWGGRSAVIQSSGQGSTITVAGNDVRLFGFTIRGSGNRFDLNDSALKVTGNNILIQGIRIEGALFGLTAEEASKVVFLGNEIAGDAARPLGLRGDAVRLWQTKDSLIEGNRISGCRDIIIWYSSHNRVAHNVIYGGRYGTHFMYSDDEQVIENRYEHAVVGIFCMYAHGIEIRGNLVKDSSEYDGMGIGAKDTDGLLAEENQLIRDNTGIYLDASPAQEPMKNVFRRNAVMLNNVGVIFHATEANTVFHGNSFRANQTVGAVEGNGDALSTEWSGNYFDDYQGYDLDRNGVGDVPYELRSFSTELMQQYPNLAFFHGSPTMYLTDVFSRIFPYLQPKLILRDSAPRMYPASIERALQ